jgi:DNA-binding transcriptional LysR family regulator
MDNLGDIRLFVEAAQQGSLSAAGRKMGLTPAAPARGWPNSKPA